MVTPDDIENRVFSLVRRGYDPHEVDEFLKVVAATLAQAQGGLATPPGPADDEADTESETETGERDDFGRLGAEVAAILRQAHESVETLRHRAEAEAALIRGTAEQEAATMVGAAQEESAALRADAEADRTQAARIREATEAEVAAKLAEIDRRIESAARAAHEEAKSRARDAVSVQRSVRGRLEDTRGDIDSALGRLVGEDDELFTAIDLTEIEPTAGGGDLPPPAQGLPSPAVPPPAGPVLDLTSDLPYAPEDTELEESEGDEPPDGAVPPEGATVNGDGANDGSAGATEGAPEEEEEGDGDLDSIVRTAVEDALRRRKGDESTAEG